MFAQIIWYWQTELPQWGPIHETKKCTFYLNLVLVMARQICQKEKVLNDIPNSKIKMKSKTLDINIVRPCWQGGNGGQMRSSRMLKDPVVLKTLLPLTSEFGFNALKTLNKKKMFYAIRKKCSLIHTSAEKDSGAVNSRTRTVPPFIS